MSNLAVCAVSIILMQLEPNRNCSHCAKTVWMMKDKTSVLKIIVWSVPKKIIVSSIIWQEAKKDVLKMKTLSLLIIALIDD